VNLVEIDTPHGPARAHLHPAEAPRAALVLGHGAGGGVGAPDLVAVADAAVSVDLSVALVEQPYLVAGKRSPAPASRLDASWVAVVEHLRGGPLEGLPAIVGGRSLGARVACRTAGTTGAIAVLCLAFPLQPPARSGKQASPSRLPELELVRVPVLIVQGENDRFGMPPAAAAREVIRVAGDHGLKKDAERVAEVAREWLARRAADAARTSPHR
jgi:predicted alpha/beta-hydrolase family hydrolase